MQPEKSQRKRLPPHAAARRGAVLVEFALTAPIALLLAFGFLEISRMNMIRNTSDNAAFEAARSCVVPGATVGKGTSVAQSLMRAIGVQDSTIVITPDPITVETTTVTVSLTTPLNSNLYLSPFFLRNGSLRSNCTLSRESLSGTGS